MTIKDYIVWFQLHLGPINRLPSWLNELLSGVLCVVVAAALLTLCNIIFHVHWLLATFPLAFGLSEFYEHVMDPWNYNPQDVVERTRGIVLMLIIAMAILL